MTLRTPGKGRTRRTNRCRACGAVSDTLIEFCSDDCREHGPDLMPEEIDAFLADRIRERRAGRLPRMQLGALDLRAQREGGPVPLTAPTLARVVSQMPLLTSTSPPLNASRRSYDRANPLTGVRQGG